MIFESMDVFNRDETHPSCHCSVIQELPGGELMAVWYAGKAEAHKTVGLKASWKELNSNSWSEPVLIHKTPGKPDGNAVITYFQDKLYMYYNVITRPIFPWESVILLKKVSKDLGRTWSEPETILGKDNKGYTVRTKPIIHDDRLLIPTGKETLREQTGQVLFTSDGESYELSKGRMELPKGGCHQPAITELPSGNLLAFLRTNQDLIYRTESNDGGESWSQAEQTPLKNPNSALDFVLTKEGELILAWNNASKKAGGMARSRRALHVGYSPDEGRTWPIIKEIERDDENGRFAYPAIIRGSDDLFHLTYTNRRKTIRYTKFDLEWLKAFSKAPS
ncbi:MAG: exo-alpha-sialidase [Promethearchaeota archaeon]